MASRQKQNLAVNAVVALAVLVVLRALTSLGVLSRFIIVVVAIILTQSVFERVYQ